MSEARREGWWSVAAVDHGIHGVAAQVEIESDI